jgi:hypothetical protein
MSGCRIGKVKMKYEVISRNLSEPEQCLKDSYNEIMDSDIEGFALVAWADSDSIVSFYCPFQDPKDMAQIAKEDIIECLLENGLIDHDK